MTMVLHTSYPNTPTGNARYLLNRGLRIYPVYLLVLTLTVLGLLFLPSVYTNIYSLIQLPESSYDWFRNFSLFQLIYSPVILIPPAWSLTVEVFYYIAMGLLLSRWKAGIIVWFILSLLYTGYLVLSEASFSDRYYPVDAASVFFATGAFLFVMRNKLTGFTLGWPTASIMFVIFLSCPLLVEMLGYDRLTVGYYGATPLFIALFIACLNRPATGVLKKIDDYLGDLTYPVFLLHFFASGIVKLLPFNLVPLGFSYFLLSTIITIGISALILAYFQPMVDRIRDRIRSGRSLLASN